MQLAHVDSAFRVEPGTSPDYNRGNSLLQIMNVVERQRLAAERECYENATPQYLFPMGALELYGPQGADANVLDPRLQDNKTDFQKQNIRRFTLADTRFIRGQVTIDGWSGPFLRVIYRGGPDSVLSGAASRPLGESIRLHLKVGGAATPSPIVVPLDPETGNYEIELWGYPGPDLRAKLDSRGQTALDRGALVARPDLIRGTAGEFTPEALDGKDVRNVAPEHALHPILPLSLEVAWSNANASAYDSLGGANHRYQFSMQVRGWTRFLGVGLSLNPHGGVGALEYRNLLSNYGAYAGSRELGRVLESWNFDAFGRKVNDTRSEPFFAVDYMDLHLLRPSAGIGLHRHRDNQEVFLLLEGQAFMIVGDWCEMPGRERAFEIRTLRAGDMAMLRGGQLHGLINATDVPLPLFMFGGYD